jgi:starvation-inducible outer membrane lipoprotein
MKSLIEMLLIGSLCYFLLAGCASSPSPAPAVITPHWLATWNKSASATGYRCTLDGKFIGATNATSFTFYSPTGHIFGVAATNKNQTSAEARQGL